MQLGGTRVLVTGGAGFIGSHLVEALSDCSVRVLDDFSTGRRDNLAVQPIQAGVELIRGDVRDAEAVAKAMAGIEVVFHLACRGVRHSLGHPVENHEVNATGTLVVLGAALRAGVRRFVHVSSSEVYGTAAYVPMEEDHPCNPQTVYGAAKLAGEAYVRAFHLAYGLPVVVIRPFNNFGPRSHFEGDAGEVMPRFVTWALHGMPPRIFGDGGQSRDFLYVADTAFWLRKSAEREDLVGQTVNFGSGRETSILELTRLVCEEAGRADLEPVFLPARPGDVLRHCAGIKKAQQLMGFAPSVSLRDGIRKLIEHLRPLQGERSALLNSMPEINWSEPLTPDLSPLRGEREKGAK